MHLVLSRPMLRATTYDHKRRTLGKERDYSQSTGLKMNVLEMGLNKVFKSRGSGLLMNDAPSPFHFLYLLSTSKYFVEGINVRLTSYNIMPCHALLKVYQVN